MFNTLYPMETIRAITKLYIQDDSSHVQKGKSRSFFWGGGGLWLSNGTKCNHTAAIISTVTCGDEHEDRDNHRRMESALKVKRHRGTERASVSGTQCGPEYMEGGEQLPRDSEPAVTRRTLVLSPKRKKRMREKTQRIQPLIAFRCSRWNWNRSPSGWI